MLLNPTLESIMKLVVRECDGLPLAIVTVAGCMRGISNPLVWQNALEELRGYTRNIKCMEDKVFACLKFSYNRLEQKDQDCFLYCALFPEDYKIKKEEIVEYWMEEGLIDELGTRQAMQYSGHSILQKLEENCMLEREVESWLKKAGEKLGHAQHVEDKVRKGNYLFRSCLGKLVDETTQTIKEVYGQGHFSNGLVVDDPSIIRVKLPTPELTGTTTITEKIYQYLMGDGVRMIGVCGMGGIGKTTIMKDVHNRLLKEAKFNKLIWATVSQDFDVRRLQKDIASQLKENLPDHENTIVRAAKLSEMLRKQGSYVLILDDVWSSFSLEDVGILEPTTDNGCKLVLTTRSEEVVRSMGCKKVQVSCLSMDEAMQLFLSKVGQDMLLNPTLESIMKLVVGECDGLPLAIVTIAGCMRGITDPLVWQNALNELRGYIRNIQDMEDKVFGCLKFSYDRLEQKDQDCFLCCALYPEDYEIKKEEIVEYWMEQGLLDEMGTRQAMQGG
ncbi:NB-ARC - like 10, partial [Theobroma cacao]